MTNQILYDNSFDIKEFIHTNKTKLNTETPPNMDELLKNAKDGKRGNGFVFTYNNFTHTPDELTELLQTLPNNSFGRFQIEKATDTGTIHYQGYIHFSKRVYWGQLRREFIKMGLHRLSHRNRIASPKDAADYCNKTHCKETGKQTKLTEPVYEWGELNNQQGERNDLAEIVERVKAGATNAELLDEYPTQFFRYKKHIDAVRSTYLEAKYRSTFRNIEVYYIHGSPRTGKTRFVLEKYGYENVCRVTEYDKWLFENYHGQKIVLFDEFDGQPKITTMNKLMEGYPMEYRCRNEDRVAMNDKVYIISNLPLSAQYTKEHAEKPKIYEAFTKRFNHIINWDNLAEREYFIAHGTSLPKQAPQQTSMEHGMTVITDPKELEGLPW